MTRRIPKGYRALNRIRNPALSILKIWVRGKEMKNPRIARSPPPYLGGYKECVLPIKNNAIKAGMKFTTASAEIDQVACWQSLLTPNW